MDFLEKIKKKNSEVIDIVSAKLQTNISLPNLPNFRTNLQNDGRPLVHNAFEDPPEEPKLAPVVAPKAKSKIEIAVEECETILQGILDGDTENVQKKLIQVVVKCDSTLTDPYDMSEMYTKVCKKLCYDGVQLPMASINAYLEMFTKRFNPLRCEELLNVVDAYLMTGYAAEYEKGEHGTPIGLYKILSTQLREKIALLAPTQNADNFEFVLMDESILNTIVEWYQNKHEDNESVKEELAELNCVYGVQNDQFFLTSSTEAADILNNQSWDMYRFKMVLFESQEVIGFSCKKNQKGEFYINHKSSNNIPDATLAAVAFFRNKEEREKFYEDYAGKNGGENPYYLKAKAHKKLFHQLGSSFHGLSNRVGANPLADTLNKFVELCECKAPEYGFKNIIVNKPATDAEITKWQQDNQIQLPEDYCDFLRFANGFDFTSSSERIAGLDEIMVTNGYVEPDYMVIGTIIGDGTLLCLSKSTGEAYIEDHGEYRCEGKFRDLFEYVIELAMG